MIGKVFELLLSKQRTSFIDPMVSYNLTAYRKNQSCEHSLIGLVERYGNRMLLTGTFSESFPLTCQRHLIPCTFPYWSANWEHTVSLTTHLPWCDHISQIGKAGLGLVEKQQVIGPRPLEAVTVLRDWRQNFWVVQQHSFTRKFFKVSGDESGPEELSLGFTCRR